jgi:6,7-dimethyl-8-ribityllumazine synthase
VSFSPPSPVSFDAAGCKIGIVASRYNGEFVDALVEQVSAYLAQAGVKPENLPVWRVPGANELPVAVKGMLDGGAFHAIVALGVIVRGGTLHYEVLAYSTADALLRLSTDTSTPVINGIVVAENEEQARERCKGSIDRGAEFAWAALEMALLKKDRFGGNQRLSQNPK